MTLTAKKVLIKYNLSIKSHADILTSCAGLRSVSDRSASKCSEDTDDHILYNEVEHVAALHNNRKLHSNVNDCFSQAVTPG